MKKCGVFGNTSTSSVSNNEVITRYSISSFSRFQFQSYALLFSQKLCFQFFTGENAEGWEQNARRSDLRDVFWILP